MSATTPCFTCEHDRAAHLITRAATWCTRCKCTEFVAYTHSPAAPKEEP